MTTKTYDRRTTALSARKRALALLLSVMMLATMVVATPLAANAGTQAVQTITFYAINSTITVSGETIFDGNTDTASTNAAGNLTFTVNPDTGMSMLAVTSNENQNQPRNPLNITGAGNSYTINAADYDGEVYVIAWPKVPSANSPFSGGEGEIGDPYIIANIDDLQQLSADVFGGYTYAGAYFTLTNNIDLNGTNTNPWLPIGGGAGNYSFEGNFNGNGNTISELYYNYASGYWSRGNTIMNNVGLFGKVEVDAVVRNLTVANGSVSSQRSVGGIVGKNWGTVDNCTNLSVTVSSSESEGVGGIVGSSWLNVRSFADYDVPTVSNCTNAASVTNTTYDAATVGGIVGENEGIIYNSTNSGTIASSFNAGGIAGSSEEVSAGGGNFISAGYTNNCYNTGDVDGIWAGGIVGFQELEAQNVYSNGIISRASDTRGAAGELIGDLSFYHGTNANLFYRTGETPVGSGSDYTAVEYDPNDDPDLPTLTDLLGYLNTWVTSNQTTPPAYKAWIAGANDYPIFSSAAPVAKVTS